MSDPKPLTPREALEARRSALDCGDNSCHYKGKGRGGMRTNGGCRCAANKPRELDRYAQGLEAMLQAVERELVVDRPDADAKPDRLALTAELLRHPIHHVLRSVLDTTSQHFIEQPCPQRRMQFVRANLQLYRLKFFRVIHSLVSCLRFSK